MTPPIVKRYFIAVGKYKWFGVAAFVAVFGAAGVVAIKPDPKPTFLAEGLLTPNKPLLVFSKTTPQVQEQAPTVNPDFLQSPEVVKAVATQVKEDPKVIQDGIRIYMPKEGAPPFIQVQFQANDPEKAKATVGALVKAMVDYSRKINALRLQATVEEVTKRLGPVSEELKQAEEKLQQFDQVEGAALSVARIGALPAAIGTVQEQQRQLRLAIEGYEAQIRSLSARLGLNPDQAYISQALSADPILASLRVQIHQNEQQLQVLKQDLREDHPKIQDLLRNQEALENLLRQRAAEVIGGDGVAAPLQGGQIRQDSNLDPARQQLASTLVNLQTERDRVRQQLEAAIRSEKELRVEYANIPNKQLERERLLQQVGIKKTLYENMQGLLADAKTAEAEVVSSVSVAGQPLKVVETTKRNLPMPLILAGGAVAGIGVGAVLIFLLSLLDGKFYTLQEVRAWLEERDLPVLGVLPTVLFDSDGEEMPIIVDRNSPYLEFYERFRTTLRRVGDTTVKVVLFSSAAADEGKSFCAYNLAIASARAGKRTLLIEADLRSQTQVLCLKVTPDLAAAIEPLRYYSQLNNCVRLVPDIENLYVIPSTGKVNVGSILESSEMHRLLQDVRGRFDFVVIDAPALSLTNDALVLEPLTDGMILVTRPLYSQPAILAEFVEPLLDGEDIHMLGVVVNGVDIPVDLYSSSPLPDRKVQAMPRSDSGSSASQMPPSPSKRSEHPQAGEVLFK